MEELQDAIEDAQYVTAISSVEDGPRPMVVWEIPNEAQLAEWKERVKVLNAKKKDSPLLPTPFEFEWTLSHALGLFLFSAYLKESVGSRLEGDFVQRRRRSLSQITCQCLQRRIVNRQLLLLLLFHRFPEMLHYHHCHRQQWRMERANNLTTSKP